MQLIFKKNIFYIRLHEDKIEIENVLTGKSIQRITLNKFSNDRLLIANFTNAELEIRDAIDALQGKSIFSRNSKIIIQPLHNNIDEYSEVEKMILRDICFHTGAKDVYLYLKNDILTGDTIILEANSKSKFFEM